MPFAQPKTLLALSLVAMTAAMSGCTTYQPAPKAFNEATIQPYTLDSGDRLRITVFEQPSLTNTYTVDQAGYIAFPLDRTGACARPYPARNFRDRSPRSCSRAICAIPT